MGCPRDSVCAWWDTTRECCRRGEDCIHDLPPVILGRRPDWPENRPRTLGEMVKDEALYGTVSRTMGAGGAAEGGCGGTSLVTPPEHDPSGKAPSTPGAKLDAGKNRLWLVLGAFTHALQQVGRVGTFGAGKYTDDGWLSVANGEQRYTDALLRHLLREAEGEAKDPDSELLHASHAAWNALARLELMLRKKDES